MTSYHVTSAVHTAAAAALRIWTVALLLRLVYDDVPAWCTMGLLDPFGKRLVSELL